MKIKNLILITIHCSGLGFSSLFAQQEFTSAGGDASSVSGSVSFSYGQVFYITVNNSTESVAQGVQQAYEISTVTDIHLSDELQVNLLVYPNPTNNSIILDLGNLEVSKMKYQLLNSNGKIIESKQISRSLEPILMEDLANAVYILKIFDSDKKIKTFKILKN